MYPSDPWNPFRAEIPDFFWKIGETTMPPCHDPRFQEKTKALQCGKRHGALVLVLWCL